jgi:hypothetical protein
VKSSVLLKELGPVGPDFRGWEITSLIPCYLAASPVVCGLLSPAELFASRSWLLNYSYTGFVSSRIWLFIFVYSYSVLLGHEKTRRSGFAGTGFF